MSLGLFSPSFLKLHLQGVPKYAKFIWGNPFNNLLVPGCTVLNTHGCIKIVINKPSCKIITVSLLCVCHFLKKMYSYFHREINYGKKKRKKQALQSSSYQLLGRNLLILLILRAVIHCCQKRSQIWIQVWGGIWKMAFPSFSNPWSYYYILSELNHCSSPAWGNLYTRVLAMWFRNTEVYPYSSIKSIPGSFTFTTDPRMEPTA